MNERTVKDVTPFEIVREIIRLGWEVHSADLILYELDKIEAENAALKRENEALRALFKPGDADLLLKAEEPE